MIKKKRNAKAILTRIVENMVDRKLKSLNEVESNINDRIIGKTKSGKSVYAGRKANHPVYRDFSSDDHHDAATLIAGQSGRSSKTSDSHHEASFLKSRK